MCHVCQQEVVARHFEENGAKEAFDNKGILDPLLELDLNLSALSLIEACFEPDSLEEGYHMERTHVLPMVYTRIKGMGSCLPRCAESRGNCMNCVRTRALRKFCRVRKADLEQWIKVVDAKYCCPECGGDVWACNHLDYLIDEYSEGSPDPSYY